MEYCSSKEMKRYNYLLGELEAAYHEMSLAFGLSDSAMKILYAICDHGECCLLKDICRSCGLSKQTVNSALRKLEAEGILYLESGHSKQKNVCFTEKGKRLAEQTAGQIMKAENEVFASWRQEDLQKYLELTEVFLVSLQEKAKRFKEGRDKK